MKVHEISTDAINLTIAENSIERTLAVLEDIRHLDGSVSAIGHLQAALSDLYGEMAEDEGTAA